MTGLARLLVCALMPPLLAVGGLLEDNLVLCIEASGEVHLEWGCGQCAPQKAPSPVLPPAQEQEARFGPGQPPAPCGGCTDVVFNTADLAVSARPCDHGSRPEGGMAPSVLAPDRDDPLRDTLFASASDPGRCPSPESPLLRSVVLRC